jgi:hypothetical protein
MEEVTTEERLRRLEDVHGEVSLGDEKQNRMLKEQLGIWKRKAGENQLIAGRWQYLFETSQKCVNRIEDIFEYTWQKMGKTDLRDYVHEELSRLTEAVSKVRKSPTEEQEKK